MAKAKRIPKEILVYQCDEIDGEPIYAVANNVDEITEDYEGVTVGAFTLNREWKFGIKRSLT